MAESTLYQVDLEQAQGIVIPRYIGIFGSEETLEGRLIPRVHTCLVLLYVDAERVTKPFKELPALHR